MSKCTDCKEYNKEKNYCPKFCDVIRNTTKEMQEFYKGEHEKLEKIKQVVNQWNDRKDADAWAYREIKKVLEQENNNESRRN